jgi:hypothetical protein
MRFECLSTNASESPMVAQVNLPAMKKVRGQLLVLDRP